MLERCGVFATLDLNAWLDRQEPASDGRAQKIATCSTRRHRIGKRRPTNYDLARRLEDEQ